VKKTLDLLGIGTAVVDYFAEVDNSFLKKHRLIKGATNFRTREALDGLHRESCEKIFLRLPGDNARNVCEGVSHLGGRSAFAGAVGRDEDGKFLSNALRELGIGSLLVEKPGKTGKILTYITPDRERTFAVDLGNGLQYDTVSDEEVAKSQYLYITSITILAPGPISETCRRVAELARDVGTKIAFSLESPPMIKKNQKILLSIIEGVEVLFANEDEINALGVAPEEISGSVGCLFLKRGGQGSTIFHDNKTFQIPKYSKKTVDTTGAGDYYAAGALFALCRSADIEKAGHEGARLAAKIVERFGASFFHESAPKERLSIVSS